MIPLLPQQTLMVDHIKAHPRCALFADPGLGKTRAVIEAAAYLLSDGAVTGVLVVAPLRVAVLTWPNEVEKWAPWMKVADLRTAEGRAAWAAGSAHIYVINYEMLPKLSEKKGGWPVDMIVWDEIHNAKNPSSKRIKAFAKHREKFTRVVGMTGTPIANSHMDLFAPMRLIDGGERLGKVYTHFRDRYFDSDWNGWNFTVKPWARDAITEKISDITLTLKAADYLDIPPTTTHDVDVHLTPEVMRQYKKLQKDCLLELANDKELVGVNAAALIGKLTQFSSGACYDEEGEVVHIHDAKITALKTIIDTLQETVLVVTMYKHERERIIRAIPGAEGWGYNSLDRWNARKIRVLVVDPRSVGAGLNLQDGGRVMVWYTQTYSRLLYDQMNARLARTGQKHDTLIYRLLCPQTVDWAIVEALRAKGEEQEGLKDALLNLRRLA
jgi:SNF2 family DNA or RNA helicase